MGARNYLIDGVSGTGKTTVAEELQQQGFHVLHGDRELAYKGNPQTGEPIVEPHHNSDADRAEWHHEHQLWDVDKIKSVISDRSHTISFFCGGSRNSHQFIGLLDGVFILEVSDLELLFERLDERVARDPTEWGSTPEEKELVAKSHISRKDIPRNGVVIDATAPLKRVVDTILQGCQ